MAEIKKIDYFDLLRQLTILREKNKGAYVQEKDFKQNFEIKKHYATFYDKGGYTKEFNLIKYDKPNIERYDLRLFKNLDNQKIMLSKGITLTAEELRELKKTLDNMEI